MSAPTKKQLASRHARRLHTMQKQLMDMSEQWEDLDQFCVNLLAGVADNLKAVSQELLGDEDGHV